MSACIKLTIYRGVPWDECLASVHQLSAQSASDKPERRKREEEGGAFESITLTNLGALILFLFLVIQNPPSQQCIHHTCEIHHLNRHLKKKSSCSTGPAASSASNMLFAPKTSVGINQSIWIIIIYNPHETKTQISVDKLGRSSCITRDSE